MQGRLGSIFGSNLVGRSELQIAMRNEFMLGATGAVVKGKSNVSGLPSFMSLPAWRAWMTADDTWDMLIMAGGHVRGRECETF